MDTSKPRIIAHRALIHGPNPRIENTPNQISHILNTTPFDIEIDVWYELETHKFFLGHDAPTTPVPDPQLSYLANPRFWIHAKNNAALFELIKHLPNHIHIFSHDRDPAVLTSTRIPWVYPGEPIGPGTVVVMPERSPEAYTQDQLKEAYAICTDYGERYYDLLAK